MELLWSLYTNRSSWKKVYRPFGSIDFPASAGIPAFRVQRVNITVRKHRRTQHLNVAYKLYWNYRMSFPRTLWPSSLVWTCPETRCGQRHPQSDEPGHTWYQTTRTPQEDVEPTTEGRHDGRGCYPGCGPRPDGVETEDNADP